MLEMIKDVVQRVDFALYRQVKKHPDEYMEFIRSSARESERRPCGILWIRAIFGRRISRAKLIKAYPHCEGYMVKCH